MLYAFDNAACLWSGARQGVSLRVSSQKPEDRQHYLVFAQALAYRALKSVSTSENHNFTFLNGKNKISQNITFL